MSKNLNIMVNYIVFVYFNVFVQRFAVFVFCLILIIFFDIWYCREFLTMIEVFRRNYCNSTTISCLNSNFFCLANLTAIFFLLTISGSQINTRFQLFIFIFMSFNSFLIFLNHWFFFIVFIFPSVFIRLLFTLFIFQVLFPSFSHIDTNNIVWLRLE